MSETANPRPVPGWEWGVSFFLLSFLLTGPFVYVGQFFGLTTTAHSAFIALWLVVIASLTLFIAMLRGFRLAASVVTLLILITAAYQSMGVIIRLGEVKAKAFGEVLVNEIRSYELEHGEFPKHDSLANDNQTCARIMSRWNALRSNMFETRFESCQQVLAGGRGVSVAVAGDRNFATVTITETGLVPGHHLRWDWNTEQWVLNQ